MQGSTSSNMNDIQNDSEHSTKIEEMEWSTGSSTNQIQNEFFFVAMLCLLIWWTQLDSSHVIGLVIMRLIQLDCGNVIGLGIMSGLIWLD